MIINRIKNQIFTRYLTPYTRPPLFWPHLIFFIHLTSDDKIIKRKAFKISPDRINLFIYR